MQIRDVPFIVMGVLRSKGQGAGGQDADDIILVPFTTAQGRLSGRQRVNQIIGSTSSAQDVPAAQEEIRSILRESHKLGEGDDDDFTIRNQDEIAAAASSTTKVMTRCLRQSLRSHCLSVASHHEHHAGVRDGADARDRHPHGHRRARLRRADTVPRRERCDQHARGLIGARSGSVRRDRRGSVDPAGSRRSYAG